MEQFIFLQKTNDASKTQRKITMKNEYDNEKFFKQYANMARSQNGLSAAGEWHQLKPLFPQLQGKKVLDLGCGYGWHCKFAIEQGAEQALGIDLSQKMIAEAQRRNADKRIQYRVCGIEEYDYPKNTWDCVISNLALHYIENIDEILDLLEPHFPKITRIHRATYFRWREQAFQAVSSILWGYEDESRQIIEYFKNNFEVE